MKNPSKSFFRFFLIYFVLISCNHGRSPVTVSDTVKTDTAITQLLTLDLKILPDISTVKLSEIGAIEVLYIPLETTPQNAISIIHKINFSNKYFVITDISNQISLSMFRNDGSFVTKVGTVGRGPNEFTFISDVDINPINESIYIANVQHNNILVYNKNGVLIKTIKSSTKNIESGVNNMMRFKLTNEGILCYYENSYGNIENSFVLFDTSGTVIKEFSNKYPWERIEPGVGYSGENLFYRFNNQLYKKEIYCDTIFAYRDKSFEPHIIIDVGNLRINPEVRANIRTRSEANAVLHNYIVPMNLFEFGDFIYYEMAVTINKVYDLFSFIGSKKDNFKVLVAAPKGLVNDIDGGPNFWPRAIKDDSTIVSWIDAIKFKEYIASEEFKNSTPRYPDKKKELEKLADAIQENDNPIIVLIKVK
jgi:hypothetical protein